MSNNSPYGGGQDYPGQFGQPHGDQPLGQSPYGQQPGGGYPAHEGVSFEKQQSGYGYTAPAPAPRPYASWFQRVLGYLVDYLCGLPFTIITSIGGYLGGNTYGTGMFDSSSHHAGALGSVLAILGNLGGLAFFVWNSCWRQGKTGQSIGKQVIGITLLDGRTGQPVGPLKAFLREIVHIVDALSCFIGYLWPLWDDKRQTFADKIMNTVVVQTPKR